MLKQLGEALLIVLLSTLVVVVLSLYIGHARAHEHQSGETDEQARVTEFLRTWARPSGNFEIPPRMHGCCYANGPQQDCFAVRQARTVNGILEVLPDTDNPDYAKWYKVNTGVNEDLQEDPRESPDGRSYVCIIGELVVCYVAGAGV